MFCAALLAAAPVRAQQPDGALVGDAFAPAPAAAAAPAASGPRLPLDWRAVQHQPQRIDVTSSYRTAHRIVLSTLTLAVIVVLVVLLIA